MARIPIHTLESAPDASRPILEAILASPGNPGRILALQGQLAEAPATLAAYISMRKAIEEHATLTPATRFAIQLTVSSAHHSDYSLAVNTMLATRAGWSDADLAALRAGAFTRDPKLARLLAVVREAATNDGTVQNATWSAAVDAGCTPAELVEAYVCIALTVFVNHFVAYAGTPVDVPGDPVPAQRRSPWT
jgi:alkylhydroperoxidase family enzyme